MNVVELALKQVGAAEVPKGSNRGPVVDQYTGGNAVPWCALFTSWLFRAVGRDLPGDYAPSPGKMSDYCSVSKTEDVFQNHGWYFMAPEAGDLVFYSDRGLSDAGPGRHIGLVVAVHADYIETVEGNWGQEVAHRKVKRSSPKIVGYGRRP